MKHSTVAFCAPAYLIFVLITTVLLCNIRPAAAMSVDQQASLATATVDATGTAAMATMFAALSKTPTPPATPTPSATATRTLTFVRTPLVTRAINRVGTAVAATLTAQAFKTQSAKATQTAEVHQIETIIATRLTGASTNTPPPTDTRTSTPVSTPTRSPMPTVAPTATPVPDTVVMEMVFVPAGEFVMGSSDAEIQLVVQECNQSEGNCRADWFDNEQPQRRVFVADFWISKYEVTNAQYNVCVTQGVCPPIGRLPQDGDIPYQEDFFSPQFPAVAVSWDNASRFCRWLGDRLPSEEEWEKAARGVDGSRRYPWGAAFDASGANLASGYPTMVGSYPTGASPYGVMDMAGNVFEWTASATGDGRYFVRGGGWSKYSFRGRAADRGTKLAPNFVNYDIGFRCAK